jgi:hypothetical protein
MNEDYDYYNFMLFLDPPVPMRLLFVVLVAYLSTEDFFNVYVMVSFSLLLSDVLGGRSWREFFLVEMIEGLA